MNCDKCNQPVPTDTPYRSSSIVDEETVPVKSNSFSLTYKARLLLWTFGSGLCRTVLGLVLFAIVGALLWCVFPGITRLGLFANNEFWHFNISSSHAGAPCFGCYLDRWWIGMLTLLVIPLGCAGIWLANRIGSWLVSLKGKRNGN